MESQNTTQIHQQLMDKKISCIDLIQEKLSLLKENAFNTVNSLLTELALEQAAKVDAKIANGETIGLLEGIPFGIKDVYMLQGTYATASSDLLKKYKSAYTATAIQKLLDAGAIPIVKENCDSFGHGSSSENTIFGAVKKRNQSSISWWWLQWRFSGECSQRLYRIFYWWRYRWLYSSASRIQ